MKQLILPYEKVGISDVGLVGGKNASLGEMIRALKGKVKVPSGFIVTADAYRFFLKETGLDVFIAKTLKGLDTKNLSDLAERGALIRTKIKKANFPKELNLGISEAYSRMEIKYGKNVDVAVRSSATAEDLPGASFAGEHETYLGIRGEEELLRAAKSAMASLFTARAISYRVDKGFSHLKIALSVGIERMVRSDKGASGVIFTLDTESGFRDVVLINGVWGLGEMMVQGRVTPDEFFVWKKGMRKNLRPIIMKRLGVKKEKMVYSDAGVMSTKQTKIVTTSTREKESFVLSDKEILLLTEWGVLIEKHYSKKNGKYTPMDIEWAKDGDTGELFIVQARPETVHAGKDYSKLTTYKLKENKTPILTGASVGSSIAVGSARVILDAKKISEFKKGEILVTDMTDPDWEPIMKIASAIITDKGGRTSHAAIVSRELGIPAVVGTEHATKKIQTGDKITVDTSGSEGAIYLGHLKFEVEYRDVRKIPSPKTKVMINVAIPDSAMKISFLPNSGVGLAREEFIIASNIGIHPQAILNFKKESPKIQRAIKSRIKGWKDPKDFYIDNLAYGISKIGAAFYPHPVIVRFSDFKTNEYRSLLGGEAYEPVEENPMIGWRGASRYYDPKFKEAFMLECIALKKVREEIGLDNCIPMIPFCRTVEEGKKTLEIMSRAGLVSKYISKSSKRNGQKIVPVYVMCEIPANVLLAEQFLEIFDGMSIGSNDLTQLVLGLDRDSGILSHIGNETNEAVKILIRDVIRLCNKKRKYIGICGQAPSDHPGFAEFLVREGIQSISLNPDTVVETTIAIYNTEKKIKRSK